MATRPRNRRHPPPLPVDEALIRSQLDEPSTRRRLRSVPPPPLRLLTRRLNAFCSIASTYFLRKKLPFGGRDDCNYIKIFSGINFLQRAQCSHCKRCISYGNSVRLSVCLSVRLSVCQSHAGIVSKRRHVARCSFHRWIAKCV